VRLVGLNELRKTYIGLLSKSYITGVSGYLLVRLPYLSVGEYTALWYC